MNSLDKTKQLLALTTVLPLFISLFVASNAFADDNSQDDFVAVTDESLKNNPMIAKILENIEKSKKEFTNSQQKTNQEKLIDEQRIIAKNILEQELEQMFKDNEEFTPLSAFKNFLNKVSDENTKTVFQGLFDYHQDKVNAARDAMHNVLRNGGSLLEARNAYYDAAAIPRADMLQLVKELNIDAGFSDPDIQNHFDSDGKLPRYDDEQESVISFVDLTSSAQNINSSVNSTDNQKTTTKSDEFTAETENDLQNSTSQSDIIQKLLEEIQNLKNKIKELESNSNSTIQKAVFEQTDSSIYFADWVADYSQGLGHRDSKVNDKKSIPVNALNKPNSYDDVNNSLALGRQGQITLGFSEPVTDNLIVYEASNEKNIRELATIEVSADGENWIPLTQTRYKTDGSYVHEYGYDMSNIGCIMQVRITDNALSEWGDGFDIDALGATKTCDMP